MGRRILLIHHSHGGSTAQLADAVRAGALDPIFDGAVEIEAPNALEANWDHLAAADAVAVVTAAHFGYMAGAVKVFFERVYHHALDTTARLPWALVANGDTDVDGAVESVERIVSALKWRNVAPPLRVVGNVDEAAVAAATEVGQTIAAHLAADL